MGASLRARIGTGSAALVATTVWVMAAVPSAGSGVCVRSVDAGDHANAASAEAALIAALADADDGVDGDGCTAWRVDLVGTFLLTSDLAWTTDVPLHLAGPANGTARLEVKAGRTADDMAHRLLTVDTPDEVTLERLVLVGGDVSRVENDDEGGAVFADVLRLIDAELRGNEAAAGGAVSTIDLHAVRTSFVENVAELRLGQGGAQGGAVYALGDVTLENVTFEENFAGDGGALWMDASFRGSGSLDATFVTFVRNGATVTGSDLHLGAGVAGLSVTLRGVVFGGVADGSVVACGGVYPYAEASRVAVFGTDTSCGLGAGDVMAKPTFGTVPFLTGTTALPASPANAPFIDAVACGSGWPTVDQRGLSRPQGAARRCDAGSVELETAISKLGENETPEPEEGSVVEPAVIPVELPIPTSIPAGGGACADGCGAIEATRRGVD